MNTRRARYSALHRGRRNFAVERHRRLQGDEGSLVADVLGESFVQLAGFGFEQPLIAPQFRPLAAWRIPCPPTSGIGIGAWPRPRASRQPDECVGARSGASGVGARLEVQVKRGAARAHRPPLQGQHFGMLASGVGVGALPDDSRHSASPSPRRRTDWARPARCLRGPARALLHESARETMQVVCPIAARTQAYMDQLVEQ